MGELKPGAGVRGPLCAAVFCLLAFAQARYAPDVFKSLGLASWGYGAIIAYAVLPFVYGAMLLWASGLWHSPNKNVRFALVLATVAFSLMAFVYSWLVLDACVGLGTCR